MRRQEMLGVVTTILFGALAVASPARAQTALESSAEARFQLDLVVPDAALKPHLPPGFTMNVATQGPAKDCNLRVIFIDRLSRTPRARTRNSSSAA
jgi:hypothetical protein